MKFVRLSILMAVVSLLSGCASQTFSIKDKGESFNIASIKDAPRIILTEFTDQREEKVFVGRIGLGYCKIDYPITALLTNRIASKLKSEGFNVDIILISDTGKERISSILKDNDAKFFLKGGLEYFYFSSFDAIMGTAKGKIDFSVHLLDPKGEPIFSKKYSSNSWKYVGFSALTAPAELVERMLDACVTDLFQDKEFINIIRLTNKTKEGLIPEIEKLSKMHSSGILSDEEFKKAKSKLLESKTTR